jgi:protein-tyrosine phosphatase
MRTKAALLGFVREAMARRYGGGRAWYRLQLARLLRRCGGLRRFERVDWRRVDRLVFVCSGNICRSPYAEARARGYGLAALSCGMRVEQTAPADPVATLVAGQRGLDLGPHRSRPVQRVQLRAGDLLVAMEPDQAQALEPVATPAGAQVTLLGLWARRPRPYVADPFGLDERYFRTCFEVIDSAVESIARRVAGALGERR